MTTLDIRLAGLTAEAEELESAAKIAAQNGMFETGAALRNRAIGIRRALEKIPATAESDLRQSIAAMIMEEAASRSGRPGKPNTLFRGICQGLGLAAKIALGTTTSPKN